jgi:hypothetical protein
MSIRNANLQPSNTPSVRGLSLLGHTISHVHIGVTPEQEAVITDATKGLAPMLRLLIEKMDRMEASIEALSRKVQVPQSESAAKYMRHGPEDGDLPIYSSSDHLRHRKARPPGDRWSNSAEKPPSDGSLIMGTRPASHVAWPGAEDDSDDGLPQYRNGL